LYVLQAQIKKYTKMQFPEGVFEQNNKQAHPNIELDQNTSVVGV
jgi:hypothetical protein